MAASKTSNRKKYCCDQCLAVSFDSKEKLFSHLKYCGIQACNAEVPENNDKIKFNN